MNQTRVEALLSAQSNTAKRVYEVVPIQEPWSARQVMAEMLRLGKTSRIDQRVLDGCLGALVEAGLVRALPQGMFVRAPVRPSPSRPAPDEAPPPPPEAPLAPGTLAHFSHIAEQLRDLAARANTLAGAIESAALAADERVEQAQAGTEKLRQLKTLLSEIT